MGETQKELIDWEKQPNGKWKAKKKDKGFTDYGWHSDWWKRAKKKMAQIRKSCNICGEYTLAEPCIHHLPDDYKSTKRKQEHWRLMKKKITGDSDDTKSQTVISGKKK